VWVVLGCLVFFYILSSDISLFCLCGWRMDEWMNGWMEEGSVSAGMIVFYVSYR